MRTQAYNHFAGRCERAAKTLSRLKRAASSETAFGLWLNDALPEATAAELRALYARVGS